MSSEDIFTKLEEVDPDTPLVLAVHGQTGPFSHRDGTTLRMVAAPGPTR